MSPVLSSVVTDTEIQRTFRMLRRSLGNARIASYDPESKERGALPGRLETAVSEPGVQEFWRG